MVSITFALRFLLLAASLVLERDVLLNLLSQIL
jgi:hypothetical protein